MKKNDKYDQVVISRYHLYNSLFLNLPFKNVFRTGTLLPLLQQHCREGFLKGHSATEILKLFFAEQLPHTNTNERFDILFNFIQYIERQVALFDSVEDAGFEQVNELTGQGTIAALLLRAKIEKKEEELREKLQKFSLRIVLTAHPTQFYPDQVLGILTDLSNAIRLNNITQINLLLQQLGKTGFINQNNPTPYDEALSLCWYLEHVFYQVIPEIISSLLDGLDIPLPDLTNSRLVTIGFWPGGDRDGNPFVTSETTLQVAALLRQLIGRCYYQDVRQLRSRLTFKGIDERIVSVEQKMYKLIFDKEKTYNQTEDLLSELTDIRNILRSEHDGLFLKMVDAFIVKIKIFGFHFASLDIRQDSRKHDAVWKSIIGKLNANRNGISFEEYDQLDERKKIDFLLSLKTNLIFLDFEDALVIETIQTILAISTIQKENGKQACHRYVISNCQSALHVIEIFTLAKLLIGHSDELALDIVPLFETIDDLAHAPEIMEILYSIPTYRNHLKTRGHHQTIMLGFSDGTKDGGYIRANWSIFRTKEALTAVSRRHGLKPLFFDGRGGPPARGGGNTHDFYASLGETIEQEEVQITVQGQTISSNFGKIAGCKYNLEQLMSAGLEGSIFKRTDNQLTDQQKIILDELAEEAYQAYLKFKNHPRFLPYLEKITPLAYFGDTHIGSRPVKRNSTKELKFEDLRAIPFVGSWAMMKQNIPGFYGVGTAIAHLAQKGKMDDLKQLYQNSLFFRTLLGNSMMSLTKTYYQATSYLAKDVEFGGFWSDMYNEYTQSKINTLEVSGQSELMEKKSNNRQSIFLREQIVLPLIVIQQYALMHMRNLTEEDKVYEEQYRKLIIRSMFGIINAARNSA